MTLNSSIDNVTSLNEWFININNASNGYPVTFFIVILWFAIYAYSANRNLDPSESSLAANFTTLIITSLLYFAGLTSLTVLLTLLVLTLANLLYKMFK